MPYKLSEIRKQTQLKVLLDPEFEYLRECLFFLKDGYPALCINGETCPLHRFVIEQTYQILSTNLVDHVNRNTLDNRLVNLRLASKSVNQRNHGACKPGYNTISGRFYAQVRTANGRISLGQFKTQAKAAQVVHEYHKFRQDLEDLKFFQVLRKHNVTIPANSYYHSLQSPIQQR